MMQKSNCNEALFHCTIIIHALDDARAVDLKSCIYQAFRCIVLRRADIEKIEQGMNHVVCHI